MQLKGLVRFFTILLVVYSVYMLSFTWVVRSHENKMAAKAKQFVNLNYANADSAAKASAYSARLKRLLDSTKDETVHFGITGAISYQKAKENELNLGLDLQGGISVTMEVELSGLLRSMANNSKDPNFLKALQNAESRKANSSADYVSLFVEEYKKLAGNNAALGPLFSAASGGKINPKDNDQKVISEIRKEAYDAFDRTFKVLQTRIDQFGVAQPNINPDRDRGIITVELPGINDQQGEDRVRKLLVSSANLQFWLTYKPEEYQVALLEAGKALAALEQVSTPTTTPPVTTTDTARNNSTDTAKGKPDTSKGKTDTNTAGVKTPDTTQTGTDPLTKYFKPTKYGLGFSINDTSVVRELLSGDVVRRAFVQAGLADAKFAFGMPGRTKEGKTENTVPLFVLKTANSDKAPMEGDVIVETGQGFDQLSNNPNVTMKTNTIGSGKWERLTKISFDEKRPIAIVLDGTVLSAPTANNGPISGGNTEITGDFTLEEAQDLANLLKSGKFAAPAKIVQSQVVGPTLGADATRGGILSFVIAFVVIFLLMLVYYNSSGWITNIALILNLLFTIGILTGLGATLTAPGIAGLILTIGLAVDTNVLTKERIKEELSQGKGYLPAINIASRRSLSPILDGHITVLLTAIILFSFGLGPVKGFATTQIIGILLSLFSGILVARWLTDAFYKKKVHFKYFTSLSRSVFQKAKFDFVGFRKKAFIISGIVLLLGIASFFNGFDYGVEFNGGRSYTVRFDKNMSSEVEQIREGLKTTFDGESPVIKTMGNANTLNITTSYHIKEVNAGADSMVLGKLYQGLQKHLPADVSYQQFAGKNVVGKTTVLPTISDDLKNGAKWATFWSIVIIALYIFIRFRDWRYSVGTIIALLHDVLVTLIVFSFARNFVPFPLEIDQHFIAAILTVIGFSMNEAIIIFDRIREDRKLSPNSPLPETINRAINETLSRTIMTSLTVFLTILILFLVGGEVTRGFAFAMLIGVITGVYSSMFVAAPMLINLGGKKKADASKTVVTSKAKPQKV